MPFDMEKWNSPADQGTVAGFAIQMSVALMAIADAIQNVAKRADVDVADDLEEVREAAKELDELFDKLTGYHK